MTTINSLSYGLFSKEKKKKSQKLCVCVDIDPCTERQNYEKHGMSKKAGILFGHIWELLDFWWKILVWGCCCWMKRYSSGKAIGRRDYKIAWFLLAAT